MCAWLDRPLPLKQTPPYLVILQIRSVQVDNCLAKNRVREQDLNLALPEAGQTFSQRALLLQPNAQTSEIEGQPFGAIENGPNGKQKGVRADFSASRRWGRFLGPLSKHQIWYRIQREVPTSCRT